MLALSKDGPARSVIDLPLWGRAIVRRFINTKEDDLLPRNGQFCALNCVYQFQYVRVGHHPGPFHILTVFAPDALVPGPSHRRSV
jgi:hypothetical protein